MTRPKSVPGEKPLFWTGSSKDDLLAFPEAVIDEIGTCSSPILCARHEKDFFLLSASSSVWDCRLIRRPAKDARRKREPCLGRVTSENDS